jgi:hypothetical protein
MPFNNNYQIGIVNNPLTESVFVIPPNSGASIPIPPSESLIITEDGQFMISETGSFLITE